MIHMRCYWQPCWLSQLKFLARPKAGSHLWKGSWLLSLEVQHFKRQHHNHISAGGRVLSVRDLVWPNKICFLAMLSSIFQTSHDNNFLFILPLTYFRFVFKLVQTLVVLVNMCGPWSVLWTVPKALPRRMWLLGDGRLRSVQAVIK